jgi:hypothetical protein
VTVLSARHEAQVSNGSHVGTQQCTRARAADQAHSNTGCHVSCLMQQCWLHSPTTPSVRDSRVLDTKPIRVTLYICEVPCAVVVLHEGAGSARRRTCWHRATRGG